MNRKLRTITVVKLRELLEDQDPDALVVFTCDYGDYGHTPQALGLKGEIDDALLTETAYSASGFALLNTDDGEEEAEAASQQTGKFLVIR